MKTHVAFIAVDFEATTAPIKLGLDLINRAYIFKTFLGLAFHIDLPLDQTNEYEGMFHHWLHNG